MVITLYVQVMASDAVHSRLLHTEARNTAWASCVWKIHLSLFFQCIHDCSIYVLCSAEWAHRKLVWYPRLDFTIKYVSKIILVQCEFFFLLEIDLCVLQHFFIFFCKALLNWKPATLQCHLQYLCLCCDVSNSQRLVWHYTYTPASPLLFSSISSHLPYLGRFMVCVAAPEQDSPLGPPQPHGSLKLLRYVVALKKKTQSSSGTANRTS